jgi:hypothetical protein
MTLARPTRLAAGLCALLLASCTCGSGGSKEPAKPGNDEKPPDLKAEVVADRVVESPAKQKVSFRFAPTTAAGIVVVEPAPKPPFTLEFLGGKGSSVNFELPYQCICPCQKCVCPPQQNPPDVQGVPLFSLESGTQIPWDGRSVRVEWKDVACPDGKTGRARTGSLEPSPPGRYKVTFNVGRDPRDCKGAAGSLLNCAAISEVVTATAEFALPNDGELVVDVSVPPR